MQMVLKDYVLTVSESDLVDARESLRKSHVLLQIQTHQGQNTDGDSGHGFELLISDLKRVYCGTLQFEATQDG